MPRQRVPANKIQVKVKTAGASRSAGASSLKIPSQSLSRAQSVFKNFTLSAAPDGAPKTSVLAGQQLSHVQQRSMVNHLKSLDASGRHLRVALPDADLKKALPSFDGKTVLLADLMGLIQRKMQGTEFYVSGHPTLTRLTIQSEASKIIETIKSGPGLEDHE